MYKLLVLCVFFNCVIKLQGCIYVAVSSDPPNLLEVNWDCEEFIHSISIYERDPMGSQDVYPITTFAVGETDFKYYKTNITFRSDPLPGGWSKENLGPKVLRSHCMYWIVAVLDGRYTTFDCFKIHPAWMGVYKKEIMPIPVPFLFIPGTHNSGSSFKKSMRRRRGISHVDNFLLTQDQCVWNQLVYGIRFLDFRIGYYPNVDPERRFWINHDMIRIQPLLPVLRDIARFIRYSPDEIIVVDFHRFPVGFQTPDMSEIHRELITMIDSELGYLAVPRPMSQARLKLEDIWNTSKRVIICYSEENMVYATKWLWSGVSQRWGNRQTPESLEAFLEKTFRDTTPRKLWAAMAELTPTPLDFLGKNSLRTMAESVNRKISNWFEKNLIWRIRANIVAVDFFRGTNIINTAINENLRKGKAIRNGEL